MRQNFLAFILGGVFALGLGLSGMTLPSKVIGFLDLAGDWDASLALVMLGAVLVYSVGYRLVRQRAKPLFAERFWLPIKREVDAPLLVGAGIFGVGWGLAGYCPGPAIVTAASLNSEAITFVLAMLLGMFGHRAFVRLKARTPKLSPPTNTSEQGRSLHAN